MNVFANKRHTNSVHHNHNILFDDITLQEVDKVKLLGLHVDKHLRWDFHVNHVCQKISSGLYALRRMSFISTLETLKLVYFSFIHSHISFGISLYGGTTQHNLNRILVLQKQAVRVMLRLKWHESVKEHFANLGIFTVFSLYIYETIMHVRKNDKDLQTLGFNHEYNTRNKSKLLFPQHKLKFFEKKPSYVGIRFLYGLPDDIRNEQNIVKFKKLLKSYLLATPLLFSMSL